MNKASTRAYVSKRKLERYQEERDKLRLKAEELRAAGATEEQVAEELDKANVSEGALSDQEEEKKQAPI